MPRKRKSNLSKRSNSARAKKVARFNETFPQAELRRLEQAERDAAHRAAKTPERSQARRLQHATYMASQRDTETIEAAESRKRAVAERAQQRRLIFTKNTWRVFDKAAFDDEVHFWLNGYVNKQNCRIWSEANPQVYVETPLHPEKLTVWCALWAGGILLQKR
ncbi:hypothetical protein TNCV_2940061 [Trichonephila clavipes]|nr:hypothetical protein TNCV_2940061 [Trichonephila clavipes]